jgi:pimeloyl-[acyl-carrier protein] methyl ester esterase
VSVTLLFAHGWALDRTLWDRVLDALGDDARGALLRDAGYYGSPSYFRADIQADGGFALAPFPLDGGRVGDGGDPSAAPQLNRPPRSRPLPHQAGEETNILGVGQSLGALELLAEPPPGLIGVVALDGFARFGKAPDFPEGVGARVLGRMKARIGEGVLAEFVQRAGGELPKGEPDAGRLIEGLDRLYTLDGRACRLPVWRLNADADPIAALALADASFEGMNVVERRVRRSTDHLSPLAAPHACVALIRAALKALR